jgi:hypothetical protein
MKGLISVCPIKLRTSILKESETNWKVWYGLLQDTRLAKMNFAGGRKGIRTVDTNIQRLVEEVWLTVSILY